MSTMLRSLLLLSAAASAAGAVISWPLQRTNYDVVIYGGTPAGCAAAIIAANGTGLSVALLEVSPNIGGMMVPGGIGLRDTDNFASAFGNGSLARKWADLNGAAYGVDYVLQPDVVVGNRSLWALVSSVPGIDVATNVGLYEGPGAVTKAGAQITSILVVSTAAENGVAAPGRHDAAPVALSAKVFIDASYDGDLAVGAGVSYTYGRESSAQYGEALAGVQPFNAFQNFADPVNPYWDQEGTQVLPYIEQGELPPVGSADSKLMPFSYRACLTQDPKLRLPFPQPPGYNSSDFELLRRYVASFNASKFPHGPILKDMVGVYTYGGPVPYPAGNGRYMKYDMCEGGSGTRGQISPMTTDQPDINDGYVTANRTQRRAIAQKIFYYVAGFMWTLANDPSIPEGTRNDTRSYGLCGDAVPYWGSAAWPTQLYIREGVRIVADYVATQVNTVKGVCQNDSIASSAWTIDIHPMRRVALPASKSPLGVASAYNEGQVGFMPFPGNGSVWEVKYAIITPKRSEATNLLVPVCNSASHVVYGSIRVEPTFIQIGQAAGAAAYLAIRDNSTVQDVNMPALQALQRANGVEPHYPPGRCPN